MLILTLLRGSSILIAPDVRIYLADRSNLAYVHLCFDAPPERKIIREEAIIKSRKIRLTTEPRRSKLQL